MQELALNAVGSWWIYPLAGFCVLVSGFFPPVPSTSLVVALAALSASSGSPNAWLLMIAMLLGSLGGDALVYFLGSRVDPASWHLLSGDAAQRGLARARHGLEHRPAVFIVAARFVPLGRLTVNLTAGVSRLPNAEFLALSLAAGIFWSAYSVAIGALAGNWMEVHPFFGVAIAIGSSIVLGYFLGKLVTWLLDRRAGRAGARQLTD